MAGKVTHLTFHSCHLLVKLIPMQSTKSWFCFGFCFFICFVLVLIIIVSGNLILGFWMSEQNKHFAWSYNSCLKGLADGRKYSIFLLACKFFKKINQPQPNLWTGEHSVEVVEWLIWSLLTMLCPGQQKTRSKRSISTWLRFQVNKNQRMPKASFSWKRERPLIIP